MKTCKEPSNTTAWLRTRSHTLRHLFLPTAVLRPQPVRRWCVPSHQKWWKHLQPCTSPSKDQRSESTAKGNTESALQRLISSFAYACSVFGLTISLKKTNVLGQDVSSTPSISIGDYTLEVVEDFTYLGSTISINLSLDTGLKNGLVKQQKRWHIRERGSGTTPCWPSTPRWRCTRSRCSARYGSEI